MAQCPTCGSNVSEQATFCPDCGTDLKPAAGAAPAGMPEAEAAPAASPPQGASASDAQMAIPPAAPELGIDEEPAVSDPSSTSTADVTPAAPAATPVAPPVQSPVPVAPARLVLKRSGAPTSEVFPVAGHVVIGRFDPETGPVDVDLGSLPEATYVSRQHAELLPDGAGQWKVKDLGSRNGVFVRKQGGGQFQRVSGEEVVSGGDELALGNARFEFQVG